MRRWLAAWDPKFPDAIVYMLQATEYEPAEFLAWFWRVRSFDEVTKRGKLDATDKAVLLRLAVRIALIASAVAVGAMIYHAFQDPRWLVPAAALVLITPVAVAYGLVVLLWLGRVTIQNRRERAIIAENTRKLEGHQGFRIAIAGSYGKTTFKEILKAVLAEGKRVAATPGNMNTPIGISRFIAKLEGDEEVLIFELGEYYPGDIAELCQLVKPQLGIMTGINEAHLSKFKTLERTTATIFELADYLKDRPVYKNGENELVRSRVHGDPLLYTAAGVNGWEVSRVRVGLSGTEFVAKKDGKTIEARSGLLGRHQIGPLVAALDIADNLGLSVQQIEAGLAKTRAFEHRMQPRQLAGAWIIDDTYNGNSDGVRTGLEWLGEVEATRRVYVTPGLVEQGSATAAVHEQIGRQIAAVANVAVLMRNSTTPHIEAGLRAAQFTGELTVIEDPLRFYENLDQFVAAGDVVLMQNDWTDNYS